MAADRAALEYLCEVGSATYKAVGHAIGLSINSHPAFHPSTLPVLRRLNRARLVRFKERNNSNYGLWLITPAGKRAVTQ